MARYRSHFRFYDSEDAGATAFWTETREVVVDRGFFAVHLGDAQALDPAAIAERSKLLLGVAVEEDAEMGRIPIGSAAYAMYASRAGDAATLDGLASKSFARSDSTCEKGSVVTGIDKDGAVVCASDGDTQYNGTDFAVANQQCPEGTVVKAISAKGVLDCMPNTQVVVTGKDFATSNQACDDNQVVIGVDDEGKLKCDADANEKYSGADFATSDQTCEDGQVISGIDANGNVVCIKDANSEYTGAQFAKSDQTCDAGQVIVGIGNDGSLKCADDSNDKYDGSNFAKSKQACPDGQVVNGVGDDGSLVCAEDANEKYTGNNFAMSDQNCPSGTQVGGIKTDGTLDCVADTDTTYDGTSFAMSGQYCDQGSAIGAIGPDGKVTCVVDADTKYDGTKFALSDQNCNPGESVVGVDKDGNVNCGTDIDTKYDGASFATSDQSCGEDHVVAGLNDKGEIVCVKDANTTYDSGAFALSDQKCPAGKFAVGVGGSGLLQCENDTNTVYDGKSFATSGQSCPAGHMVAGLDTDGKVQCVADVDTKYSGVDFATSDQACSEGQVIGGLSKTGAIVCVTDQNTQYDGASFAKSTQSCGNGTVVKGISATGTLECVTDTNDQLDQAGVAAYGKKIGYAITAELPKVAQTGDYKDLKNPMFDLNQGATAISTQAFAQQGPGGKNRVLVGYYGSAQNNGTVDVYSSGGQKATLNANWKNAGELKLWNPNGYASFLLSHYNSTYPNHSYQVLYGDLGQRRVTSYASPYDEAGGTYWSHNDKNDSNKTYENARIWSNSQFSHPSSGRLTLWHNNNSAHDFVAGATFKSWRQYGKDGLNTKFNLYNYDDGGPVMQMYGPNKKNNIRLSFWSGYPDDGWMGVYNPDGKSVFSVGSKPGVGGSLVVNNSTGSVKGRLAVHGDGNGYINLYGASGTLNLLMGAYDTNNLEQGQISVYNEVSKRALQLYSTTDGGSLKVYNGAEVERIRLKTSGGGGKYGYGYIYGANSVNIGFGRYANDDRGYINVRDTAGTIQAGMYIDSNNKGIVFADTKNFRIDHPEKPGKEIWYASVEGPEAAAYVRGTATLKDGKATIKFPDHFRVVANPKGMTIQTSPHSAQSMGLAVTSRSKAGFEVTELHSGSGNYQFDWEAKAVRVGHEDYQPVRDRDPELMGDVSDESAR